MAIVPKDTPWLVGLWRGIGHSIIISILGSLTIMVTSGQFNLRDIVVPLLVIAQRTLEGVKDGKAAK